MVNQDQTARVSVLFAVMLAYGMASLLHHGHNATFLDEYPNMPTWLTPASVFAAWFSVTLAGLIGYLLVRRGHRLAGLTALAAYGAFGLDALAHYRLAPFSAHSLTMNLTICLEVATGLLLLLAALPMLIKDLRETSLAVD